MGNSLLLLFQRNHILHKSYLFVEIAYIYLFPVQEFIQRTELGCGELTRKQVEKRGRVELDILADVGYRLFMIRLWSKASALISGKATQFAIYSSRPRLSVRSIFTRER